MFIFSLLSGLFSSCEAVFEIWEKIFGHDKGTKIALCYLKAKNRLILLLGRA